MNNFRTSTTLATARRVACLLALSLLTACATGPRIVHTEVTSFDAWSSLPSDKSYVFARTLEYQNSLEMQSYEDIVRDELQIRGFRLTTDPARAQLTVTLRPSVVGLQVRIRDPFYDPFFYRPWGYGRFGGFYGPWGPGWYGPPYPYDDTAEVYRRRLEIDIDSREPGGKRFYEGRADSTGESDALPPVVPILIHAIFSDFPGNSGQTRRVDVTVDTKAK